MESFLANICAEEYQALAEIVVASKNLVVRKQRDFLAHNLQQRNILYLL